MALQNSQVVALQLEKVRPKLPILYERDDTFFSLIQKRDVERVSTRTARIPLQVQPGGAFGAASFDGGDLGRGSGTIYDYAQLTPVGIRFAVEITKLVEYATDASDKAIENAAKRNVADAMKQFRRDLDASLQTAGNGVFATITNVAGTTFTLANTPFGARLLHENMNVQVYDTTLTTNRGSATVTSVQKGLGVTQSITVSAAPAGTVATDVLVVDGVSGASPTFIYGIPYHQNSSTSGTWMGISRSNPYAVANGVNANNAALTLPPIRLAFNQIRQAIGVDALGSLLWHGHPSQVAAYEELGFVISEIEKGGSNQDLELLFGFNLSQAVAYLLCKSPASAEYPRGRTYVIDEYAAQHQPAAQFAQACHERFAGPHRIGDWFLSPDAWSQSGGGHSLADQMQEATGIGFQRADNDRIGGAMLIYSQLDKGELLISANCRQLREALPTRIHDPARPDDILKISGDPLDDCFDAVRYALYSFIGPARMSAKSRILSAPHSPDPTIAAVQFRLAEQRMAKDQTLATYLPRRRHRWG